MGFPRQEYWSGLPFPPPGDLPNAGMEPTSLALAGGFFTTEPPGKPKKKYSLLDVAQHISIPGTWYPKQDSASAGTRRNLAPVNPHQDSVQSRLGGLGEALQRGGGGGVRIQDGHSLCLTCCLRQDLRRVDGTEAGTGLTSEG